MKPISMIAAIAENNGIGKDNQLLFYIPEDLKRFKQITSGHTVIMGRKTWESLKNKPLPNRKNIILTNSKKITYPGATLVTCLEEALQQCSDASENFIVGGEMIYRLFLPFAQILYITKVHANFDADTFFPNIDEHQWELQEVLEGTSGKELPFTFEFLTYHRKN